MLLKLPYRLFLILMTIWIFLFIPEKLSAQVSPSQFDFPQNHLSWFTLESEHFFVHYQEGNSRTAQVVSKIADRIYEPVTSLYGHEPRKKVSIVLRDREDFSNGAAFFYDDKIEIWLPALDTPLRGTHPWLENVITHEFTHIVQLGASMKRSQRIPAIYLQWLNYEDVRRPDVLYGFPNGIVSLPFAGVKIPAWFAEGTAQYQVIGHSYDYWDSHRDMLLRTRILSGTQLSLTEMGTFSSKNSLERELVYNQGYNFTIFLISRFGQEVVAELSAASANSRSGNFNHALEQVTGIPADSLHALWIAEKKEYYLHQIKEIDETETQIIEGRGFLNFYPQYNSDGSVFGYLTNAHRQFGRTSLLLRTDSGEKTIDDLGGPEYFDTGQSYQAAHGHQSNPSIEFVSNRFSFSPDGDRVLYSRADKNRYGETYQDLYIYTIETDERQQITQSSRIQDPAWHPYRNIAAAVQQTDGTQNLVIFNFDSGTTELITSFQSGETVYTPVWSSDGNKLYFSTAAAGNRNIYSADPESGAIHSIFSDALVDFRDPWIDPATGHLYFSSDISGIFNIYRKSSESGDIEQLTDIHGGAFMPSTQNGVLYFSGYYTDGYKINRVSLREGYPNLTDTFNLYRSRVDDESGIAATSSLFNGVKSLQNHYDSSDETLQITLSEGDREIDLTWSRYRETTTGLSIFPVIRFDNYTKPEGSNSRLLRNAHFGSMSQNIWRDFKAGAYFSSRDVTERFSIFGGALIGWGSTAADSPANFFSPARLNNLDRDLFFIAEYKGLPFIRRSWSPTISVEVYNIKRNVKNGITIEEFACTSCLPTERGIDIRYNLWEANLFLRSKLNRWSLVELGAAISPYSVSTEGFFSQEFREFIPGSTSEYFRGSSYSASYILDATMPSVHADIAPEGLRGMFTYRFEPGRLLDDFEISDGTLTPVFLRENNHSLELRGRIGYSVGSSYTTMFTTRGFAYLNNPEEFFYLDYAGGLSGMRSYPYFALGGQRTWFARASLLRPLFTNINRQSGSYTFDKIFAHLFYETGNGWGGPLLTGDNLKHGLGAEVRFSFNNSYLFPMKFFINTTYGLNRFNVNLPSQFISTTGTDRVQYGREILFYFGLTFDFELL